ncbi:glycoside hydrolase family 66 protein [Bacillus atrophaeus]|uniref:glycoside hydrolase family 66 protein n=1 Tax=Bacillus atrophaeus TaxID=1452 RepID=UPI00399082C8
MIYDVTTDKSMYRPGENVKIQIDLKNRTGRDISNSKVEIKIKHLMVINWKPSGMVIQVGKITLSLRWCTRK